MNVVPQTDSTSSRLQAMTQNGDNDQPAGSVKKINLTQARKILGVSPNKMSKLISDGTLAYEQDPLDQRVKLVVLKDVENLKRISAKSS
jgi:hypothetical protein